MTDGFEKYRQRGAYHWRALSRLPWRHHCFTSARYGLVLESMEKWAGRSPGRVLDLGCGDGALTSLLARRASECIGIEPNDLGRELAQRMLEAKGSSLTVLPRIEDAPQGVWDVVVCAEVIEHVDDASALLNGVRGLLRPGGLAIITTPVRLTDAPLDREHVREFFPQELVSTVDAVLEVREHTTALPVFAVELYYWRPWFFLKLPVIRWTMNVLSGVCGLVVMRGVRGLNRFPMIQLVVAERTDVPGGDRAEPQDAPTIP